MVPSYNGDVEPKKMERGQKVNIYLNARVLTRQLEKLKKDSCVEKGTSGWEVKGE